MLCYIRKERHRGKSLRGGNNYKSDNFEMNILDLGELEKALEGPENLQTEGGMWKTIYEVINDK